MLIKQFVGGHNSKNARLSLNALWLFCFFVEARLLTLPLVYPKMTWEGILAALLTAACLWVWVQQEAMDVQKRALNKVTRYGNVDTSRPWLSYWVMIGAMAAGVMVAMVITGFAAIVASAMGWK